MKKDRRDILKELREEVILAKATNAAIDIHNVIEAHLEDAVDSIEIEEMASEWIYSRVAVEANSRDMYSIGDKIYMDYKQASEEQLIQMVANQIERRDYAEGTLEKLLDDNMTFNYELGKPETKEQRIARIKARAYDEVAKRKKAI